MVFLLDRKKAWRKEGCLEYLYSLSHKIYILIYKRILETLTKFSLGNSSWK